MKRILAVVAVIAPLLAGAPVHAADPCPSNGSFSRTDAMVAMSDGVHLDTSVYIPTGAGSGLPLLVRQHGGGSNKDNDFDRCHALDAVRTGAFALLMYSARGHGSSEGIFDFFGPRTTKDFSEELDWVANTFPSIDVTRTGVYGYSQGGGESLLPAEHDARIKAVAVGNTFDSLNAALNPNDSYKLSIATAIFSLAYKLSASKTNDDLAARWGAQLMTDTEDVGAGPVPSTTDDLASRSPITDMAQLNVPVFWAQGFEDPLFPADMPPRILESLRARGIPVHYYFSSGGHFSSADFPDDLSLKEHSMLEWFEEFLLGADHGFRSGARPLADYWQRTAPGSPGVWEHHTATSWPPPGATTESLFLGTGGTLASQPQAAGPIASIVNDSASANLGHDPAVLTVADTIDGGIQPNVPLPLSLGGTVRSVPESPNPLDTATFTSAPLAAPKELVGAASIHVPETTTAPRQIQLSAKLWDLSSSGATLVARGSITSEQPGSPIDLALWPNAHRFPAGDQIVLTLSAVDFPMFMPAQDPAVTTLLSGSRLELPTLPAT